jgi:hypothetical protein
MHVLEGHEHFDMFPALTVGYDSPKKLRHKPVRDLPSVRETEGEGTVSGAL